MLSARVIIFDVCVYRDQLYEKRGKDEKKK